MLDRVLVNCQFRAMAKLRIEEQKERPKGDRRREVHAYDWGAHLNLPSLQSKTEILDSPNDSKVKLLSTIESVKRQRYSARP